MLKKSGLFGLATSCGMKRADKHKLHPWNLDVFLKQSRVSKHSST